MISDINLDTIVRCEFEDEERLYRNYYGKIAGRPKTDVNLGPMNCEMIKPFKRINGKLINH